MMLWTVRGVRSWLAIALILGVACTGGVAPSPSGTSPSAPTREERWAEDIAYLMGEMEARHPDLGHGVSVERLRAQAGALTERLSSLSDDEVLAGLMRLVATVSARGRDGHMGLWPPDNPDTIRRFPLRLWEFPDGLYVTAARAPHEALVGARILSIAGTPIRDVLRRLDPVVPRDNASNLRAARLVYLTSGEVLAGLGITDDPSSVALTVASAHGGRAEVTVEAVDAQTYADWVGGWELLPPAQPGLAFLRDASAPFRVGFLSTPGALYVQYDEIAETSDDVVRAIQAATKRHKATHLVLDLRANGGGEAGGYRALLLYLADPRHGWPGALTVLIGRLTFSGAASLTALLRKRVPDAVFVGEPSGGAPSLWADPDTVTLPNSGLEVLIATRYFNVADSPETQLTIEPDISVPMTAADYFAGRDAALTRALHD